MNKNRKYIPPAIICVDMDSQDIIATSDGQVTMSIRTNEYDNNYRQTKRRSTLFDVEGVDDYCDYSNF